jgi:hypothetical protein
MAVKKGKRRLGFDPALAWWFLSRAQKEALRAERLRGRFGGTPEPMYWPQQDVGMSYVGIVGSHYTKRANDIVKGRFHAVVQEIMRRA